MNKISIIIAREYNVRVRKKSFIIMTILTPILMALLIILPTYLTMRGDTDLKKIAVIENGSDLFTGTIKNSNEAEFVYLDDVDLNTLKNSFEEAGYYGILYIDPAVVSTPNAVQLISKKQPPIGLINYINTSLKNEIERQKLLAYDIENLDRILKEINTSVSVQTIRIDKEGDTRQTSTGVAMAIAYIGGLLMYMLVFMFGSMVMRGVIEEKTSRIVEVIISSVKPIQLMMGKIIGIALVGLTQFMIWILLTIGFVGIAKNMIIGKTEGAVAISAVQESRDFMSAASSAQAIPEARATEELSEFMDLFNTAMNQDWGLIIFSFLFYFITGYLLYASLFAAIGSAVDNETETQQFMLPITIPILLGLIVAMGTMTNPESQLSFWFSMIPLTSPIVMMARIPFDVPAWQLAVSMLVMAITIVGVIWMAAKIYRTGILMYGKKISWREMWKWLKYKR
ncbi:MAG TPA: ABC transporter permease [Bacteroidetes bacterium]|jgi:ABC-2 type transport system permease protein|nr:ABC transporter permease [Bacteroidota bacterium]